MRVVRFGNEANDVIQGFNEDSFAFLQESDQLSRDGLPELGQLLLGLEETLIIPISLDNVGKVNK